MPKSIARGERMDKTIAIRATESDCAELKLAALNQGMDVSCFLRHILIREKILTPTGVNKTTKW